MVYVIAAWLIMQVAGSVRMQRRLAGLEQDVGKHEVCLLYTSDAADDYLTV